jgi:hypothetical protein
MRGASALLIDKQNGGKKNAIGWRCRQNAAPQQSLTGKVAHSPKKQIEVAVASGPIRTNPESCRPLPRVTGFIYSMRTATVLVFFAHGPGLYPRRCRRVAAKSNADEHSSRPHGARWRF